MSDRFQLVEKNTHTKQAGLLQKLNEDMSKVLKVW